MIKEKDQIIRQQAEELGELREKLKNAQAGKNEITHHHALCSGRSCSLMYFCKKYKISSCPLN